MLILRYGCPWTLNFSVEIFSIEIPLSLTFQIFLFIIALNQKRNFQVSTFLIVLTMEAMNSKNTMSAAQNAVLITHSEI